MAGYNFPDEEKISRVEVTFKALLETERTKSPDLTLEEFAPIAKRVLSPDYAEIVDMLVARKERDREFVTALGSSNISRDKTFMSWYGGPGNFAHSWQKYYASLRSRPGMAKVAEKVDAESNIVLSSLADPRTPQLKKKGLVLGYVQSGKTSNYTAVIAKAVACGYRLIIVLAGMHNSLRNQTHARLASDLTLDEPAVRGAGICPIEWRQLTEFNGDDESQDLNPINRDMARGMVQNADRQALIAVVKKNASRLRHLEKFLEDATPDALQNCPVLIIDDEADQATPNTAAAKQEVSAINRLLRSIWGKVSRGTYVAYTATPFANLLLNPDDNDELYPSDFIYAMDKPAGYMGSEYFFGSQGADPEHSLVREIPEDESSLIDPPSRKGKPEEQPEMVQSLRRAIIWFLLATAIRRVRGHRGHSSMLIHTTMKTDKHEALSRLVLSYLDELKRLRTSDRNSFLAQCQEVFATETDPEKGEPLSVDIAWTQVTGVIDNVLDSVNVVVDNSLSEERLSYSDDDPTTVIAIGGNTLARGLTLEQLVCSYFTRTSKTYDTLLQMGRWFGFRPNYGDLVRLWLGPGLRNDFAFLAEVEADLRDEIAAMIADQRRPGDIGLKIRSHPGRLDITARNKMYFAEITETSLQGRRLHTHRFVPKQDAIDHNRAVLTDLLDRLEAYGRQPEPSVRANTSHLVFRNVSTSCVEPFFENFSVAQALATLQPEVTGSWLRRFGKNCHWNIVLVSPRGNIPLDLTDNIRINLTNRAKLKDICDEDGAVSIKALIAPSDLSIDFVTPTGMANASPTEILRERRKQTNNAGLLLLYMINKDSPANEKQRVAGVREDLGADDHVPAFGVIFPQLDLPGDHDYVRVKMEHPADFHLQDEDDGDNI